MDFAAIILAAGFSSRMKAFKPLLPLGRMTIVDTVLDSFKKAGVQDILVVVGHRGEEIRRHLVDADVTIVENPRFEEGMFTSVQAGAGGLDPGCRAFFMLPVDIPLCRTWTMRLLKEEFERTDPDVLFPVFTGRRGHPPLISGRLAREILDAGDGVTLRDVLARHKDASHHMEVPDRHILFDVDTPEAYTELGALASVWDIPTPEECDLVFRRLGPPNREVQDHCLAVARVAERIGVALMETGPDLHLNMDLVRAGALLHDIAKDHEQHDRLGGEWLEERGFSRVAEIVARHSDMVLSSNDEISEAEIVYLADKMVLGERIVSVDYRYREAMGRYGVNPAARQCIEERHKRALISQGRVEGRLRAPIAAFISTSMDHCSPNCGDGN